MAIIFKSFCLSFRLSFCLFCVVLCCFPESSEHHLFLSGLFPLIDKSIWGNPKILISNNQSTIWVPNITAFSKKISLLSPPHVLCNIFPPCFKRLKTWYLFCSRHNRPTGEMQGERRVVISGEEESHSVVSTLTVCFMLWQALCVLNPFNTQAALRGRLFYLHFTDLTATKSGYGVWAQNPDSFYSKISATDQFTTLSPASCFYWQVDGMKVSPGESRQDTSLPQSPSPLLMTARSPYTQTHAAVCDISKWGSGAHHLPFIYKHGNWVTPFGKCRIKSRHQISSLSIL